MTLHWIWLAGRPGLGPVRTRRLLECFGTAEALYGASTEELRRAGLSAAGCSVLSDKDLTAARGIAETCRAQEIRVLTLADPAYPEKLRAVEDAPPVLYCRGTLPDLTGRPCIGLVGARKADARGLALALQLGWQIAGCGGAVATGMARGIDARAAQGALEQGGTVVGVLGCGVDVVYPAENRPLFDRVCRQGCLLSEYPPGTAPNARHFPARNRIISALSDGVAVIQATEQSGALITARWAADQGRDVFAVPGPAGEPLSRGCNRLLREGAILAESGWDVVCEYAYRYPAAVREYHGRPPAAGPEAGSAPMPAPERPASARDRRPPAPKPAASAPKPVLPAETETLPPVQRQILTALSEGSLQLDALIDKTGLAPAEILPQLTLLQMKRQIACEPGKRYTLTGGR